MPVHVAGNPGAPELVNRHCVRHTSISSSACMRGLVPTDVRESRLASFQLRLVLVVIAGVVSLLAYHVRVSKTRL